MANTNLCINRIGMALTDLVCSVTRASNERVAGSAAPESVAAGEQDNVAQSSQQSQSLLTIKTTCLELLESGSEHVQALVRTIGPDSLILASATCVRSTLEPCARIMWLLDCNTNEHDRIGRVFAYRYAGQEESRKFARSANLPADEKRAKDNMRNIINDASGRGYDVLKDKNGRTSGIHERIPSATKMINDYLKEEELYRLLSAVEHGHEWAIRSFAFQKTGSRPNTVVDGVPAVAHRKRHNDILFITWLAIMITKAFSMAALTYGGYVGWDKQNLDGIRTADQRLLVTANAILKQN